VKTKFKLKIFHNIASLDSKHKHNRYKMYHCHLLINWSERSACASGQHLGGHYFAYINLFFFLLAPPLFKTTEGVVVGFHIFAWAPKKNNKNSEKK
jgi:hypothetical protein